MNCPHDHRGDDTCPACYEAAADDAADFAEDLARCKHERLTAPATAAGELLWCKDCGAFRLKEQPGVWAIPESVSRAIALDERLNRPGDTETDATGDSGEKIVN